MTNRGARLATLLLVILGLPLGLAACGDDAPEAAATGTSAAAGELRLGYFPNLTHATAIAGVERGIFARALGSTTLKATTFNAGPAAVEALFSEAIDATYIGPGPAINAFVKSKGKAIRVISGATSGGAALVVKPSIAKAADLKGKKLASPQLGNTQDVALRAWLAEQGLATDLQGGGDVSISPQENAQTLETFKTGDIDGAWVPEPWATRLVQEGGGTVLVDERDLWEGGRFVTTHLVVRTAFMEEHPDAVKALLEGQVEANDWINANAEEARTVVNAGIEKITSKALKPETIATAWENLSFTNDPIAASLEIGARHATAVGLLDDADLEGIYDLTLLNEVLAAAGKEEVQAR
jgi:NitT/TauT family transport system substrate-binding protein